MAEDDARFMERMFGLRRGAALESAGLRAALENQYRVTMGEMENLSRTTVVSTAYKKAVDVAVQAVQGGVSDYQSAIRRVLNEAAEEALKVKYEDNEVLKAKYVSGRSMRLDSAARQNVLDGVRSLQQAGLNALGEELGADGVEIDAHFLCAEDHLPYQGRQYSMKEFADLQSRLPRKIGQYNCKHMAVPILLGAPPAYSEETLEEMRRNSAEKIEIDGRTMSRYEWTQEQRRIETAVRYQKDRGVLATHAGNMEIRRDAQGKINALMGRYEKISEKAGLHERRSWTYVEGFEHVKLKKPAAKGTPGATDATLLAKDETDILKRFRRPGNPALKSGVDSPEELERIVRKRYNEGTDIAKAAYDKYIPRGGAVVDGNYGGTAFHDPNTKEVFMNFKKDVRNPKGAGTTWFHEHGHYLDAAAAVNGRRPSFDLEFMRAINTDVKTYERLIKNTGHYTKVGDARVAIGRELVRKGDATSGVQDIFGSVFGDFYPGANWGHDSTYWNSNKPVKVTRETFAHFFEASFSSDKTRMMQEYFPNAWGEFERILKGVI